ncbi:uncharacterized protein LOC115484356 [Serinus canaria]|uniref:uncharacterized protein LOC115484356 n=1 Tax=Serinus canaria TaxID=9135 RepID=UPI0021CC4F49|nr:uncharacterized protein LOC115484356 [Serinus canaria]
MNQVKKKKKPRKVSKIHILLPEHPSLSPRDCKGASDATFPSAFPAKATAQIVRKFASPLFGAVVKFPETKRICKCFLTGALEQQVLQGGNFAMAAGGVTALNWDKIRFLDGYMLLEELCWTMLTTQTIFPIQIFTIGGVWIFFPTFPSREKSKAQALGEQSPLPFTAEVGSIEMFSHEQIFLGILPLFPGGLILSLRISKGKAMFPLPGYGGDTSESWNGLGWKGPSNSSSSTPCHGQGHLPLSQVAPSLIQLGLGHFQGSRSSHTTLGIPSQPLTTLTGNNSFPVSHLPLPSGSRKPFPVSCDSRPCPKSLSSSPGAPSGTGKGSEVSLEPSLLQAGHSQLSQPGSRAEGLHPLASYRSAPAAPGSSAVGDPGAASCESLWSPPHSVKETHFAVGCHSPHDPIPTEQRI